MLVNNSLNSKELFHFMRELLLHSAKPVLLFLSKQSDTHVHSQLLRCRSVTIRNLLTLTTNAMVLSSLLSCVQPIPLFFRFPVSRFHWETFSAKDSGKSSRRPPGPRLHSATESDKCARACYRYRHVLRALIEELFDKTFVKRTMLRQ